MRRHPADRMALNVWVARNRRVAYCAVDAQWGDFERVRWRGRIFRCLRCGTRRWLR